MDKKEANLLPKCCMSYNDSSSSSSEESSDESTDSDNESNFYRSDRSNSKKSSTRKLQKRFKKKQTRWATYTTRFKRFSNSPRVHFVYEKTFFVVFLLLFSYMILCEFTYYETVETYLFERQITNSTFNESSTETIKTEFNETHNYYDEYFYNSTSLKIVKDVVKKPSWVEYLLIYWMIALMAEEARQYFFGDIDTKVVKNKLLHFFQSSWNMVDIIGLLVFSIGMSLRFLSMNTNENLFIAARLILCIDLCIWYTRLLHLCYIFKSLGPKLVMIQKMMRDLMFFMSFISIFVCLFGVTTQGTLYPGNKLSFDLIKNIFNKAYWPIYGEMKILNELEDCDPKTDVCPETSGVAFSFIFLMIYMVIANVLLINLLIAMFSSTFQDVQDRTDQIWKFQRYRLIFEYYDSPILPPPMNIFAYFMSLIQYFINKRINLKKLNESDDSTETTKDDVDLLLDRERKFAEEYLRIEQFRMKDTTDSRLKWNAEKLETLEQKLNEVIETRFKESNQLSVAINWIMSEMDKDKNRAPFIQNIYSKARK